MNETTQQATQTGQITETEQNAPPRQPPQPPQPSGPPASGPPASGPPASGSQAGAPPPRPPRPRRRVAATIAAAAAAASLVGGVTGGVVGRMTAPDTAATSSSASAGSTITGEKAADTTSLSPATVSAIAKAVSPSVVEVKTATMNGRAIGSGIILSSDGRILTNNHVIADAANGQGRIQVAFNDGSTASARVIGTDADSDLAVLQAEDVSGLTPAKLGDSSNVKVGDPVVAIGSPEGLQGTVTSGIVSYLNRPVTVRTPGSGSGSPEAGYGSPFGQGSHGFGSSGSSEGSGGTTTYKAIQTDAALNPGNSGGPLINAQGEVIGINSAMYSPTDASGSSSGNVGLGFAIPIDQAKSIIGSLEDSGTVTS